jgi:hypothetical protein
MGWGGESSLLFSNIKTILEILPMVGRAGGFVATRLAIDLFSFHSTVKLIVIASVIS